MCYEMVPFLITQWLPEQLEKEVLSIDSVSSSCVVFNHQLLSVLLVHGAGGGRSEPQPFPGCSVPPAAQGTLRRRHLRSRDG